MPPPSTPSRFTMLTAWRSREKCAVGKVQQITNGCSALLAALAFSPAPLAEPNSRFRWEASMSPACLNQTTNAGSPGVSPGSAPCRFRNTRKIAPMPWRRPDELGQNLAASTRPRKIFLGAEMSQGAVCHVLRLARPCVCHIRYPKGKKARRVGGRLIPLCRVLMLLWTLRAITAFPFGFYDI